MLLAYRLYGEGPVDFHHLRYLYVTSPYFNPVGDDWFDKSVYYIYTLALARILVKRGGKYYISKKWLRRIPEIERRCGGQLPATLPS